MHTYETPEAIAITVDLVLGDLRVTASDRTDTAATVLPTNASNPADVTAANDTRVGYVDGRLTINAPKHWKRFTPFDDDGSVQVSLEVPTGSALEATSSLGDIQIEGELGRCQVKTAMGNIRLDQSARLTLKTSFGNVDVDRVEGDADITTGSGEVRVGQVLGTAIIKNSNGATSIDDVTGDVRVKAANGNISITRADRSIVAKTAAGSITVGELRRGIAVLETAAGDVSCGFADGTAVSLDVRSKYGQIRSALDTSDGPAPTDEIVELRAQTSAGDITLYRTDHRAPRAS